MTRIEIRMGRPTVANRAFGMCAVMPSCIDGRKVSSTTWQFFGVAMRTERMFIQESKSEAAAAVMPHRCFRTKLMESHAVNCPDCLTARQVNHSHGFQAN